MLSDQHPDQIYKALVADLAYSAVPTSIMGLALISMGLYMHSTLGGTAILVATIVGGLASAAKIGLTAYHRRFNEGGYRSLAGTRRMEALHAITTTAVAGSVGALAAIGFGQADHSIHVVATALVFGYCAGVVCRLSVRPIIASGAVAIAAIPAIISMLGVQTTPLSIVAIMLCVFVLGAMETIRHTHRNSRKHIVAQLQLAELARRDPLTGLLNRLAMKEAFDDLRRSSAGIVAVHAFDLDGFKIVNDQEGHAAGDQLLKQLAERLRALLGKGDLAVRLGGDEFVVIQAEAGSRHDVDAFARKIHHVVTQPYLIARAPARIGLSLGSSMVERAEDGDLQSMLQAADLACYRAKRRGGGMQLAA